ncbi:MAG: hypothetical protein QM676_13155 [Novosphingobium sp.]
MGAIMVAVVSMAFSFVCQFWIREDKLLRAALSPLVISLIFLVFVAALWLILDHGQFFDYIRREGDFWALTLIFGWFLPLSLGSIVGCLLQMCVSWLVAGGKSQGENP